MAQSKLARAHEIFSEAARAGSIVTQEQLVEGTGWRPATVRTYFQKQWEGFTHPHPNGGYTVERSILDYPIDVFERINSQKFLINKDPFKPVLSVQAESLISKSREAALLAVQVYNNPLLNFRMPSFIIHMVIAYTSLFHAIFKEEGRDYTYKDKNGIAKLSSSGSPWLWDLSECAKQFWGPDHSAIRANLELFIELRNEIEHRYAPDFDARMVEYCQSLLLNYEQIVTERFSPYYALGSQISIPLQISKISTQSRTDALKELQREDFQILSHLVDSYTNALDEDIRGSVDFQFKVLLVQVPANHASSADASMRFVKFEDLSEKVREELRDAITIIKTRTVSVVNKDYVKPSVVVKLVQQTEPRFRLHEHQLAWKYFDVRPNVKQAEGCDLRYCHYDEPHGDFVYTPAWVQKLREAVQDAEVYDAIRNFKPSKS